MDLSPLVVDLDGTLIKTDLLVETGVSALRENPVVLFSMLKHLLTGKAALKSFLAQHVEIDCSTLPYDEDVLKFIRTEKLKGRLIVLATASHQSLADKVAQHLGLFDKVIGTHTHNLSATRKCNELVELYGEKSFDYIGNSHDDFAVWAGANKAYLANPDFGVKNKALKLINFSAQISTKSPSIPAWIKALRPHQWMKNLLIFIPLLASHRAIDSTFLTLGLTAFIVFGLCASSVYILNDVLDVQDDRHHRQKKKRPFAAGRLSLTSGLLAFPILLLISMGTAYAFLPLNFLWVLSIYYVSTVLYSFSLKRIMVLDVITLATLYTVRIVAGTFCFGLSLTFWLLAFSMFIFLSLALVKRYAELHLARKDGKSSKTRGRGYYPDDLQMIASLGAASGYLSVMVLALYIQDGATTALYSYPQMIWFACPLLLFWISRTWLLAHRGLMHDDPVVFAMKDRISLLIGILVGMIFWIAS